MSRPWPRPADRRQDGSPSAAPPAGRPRRAVARPGGHRLRPDRRAAAPLRHLPWHLGGRRAAGGHLRRGGRGLPRHRNPGRPAGSARRSGGLARRRLAAPRGRQPAAGRAAAVRGRRAARAGRGGGGAGRARARRSAARRAAAQPVAGRLPRLLPGGARHGDPGARAADPERLADRRLGGDPGRAGGGRRARALAVPRRGDGDLPRRQRGAVLGRAVAPCTTTFEELCPTALVPGGGGGA